MLQKSLLSSVIYSLLACSGGDAFWTTPCTSRRLKNPGYLFLSTTTRFSTTQLLARSEDDKNAFDVEAARRQLEALVQAEPQSGENSPKAQQQQPAPPTPSQEMKKQETTRDTSPRSFLDFIFRPHQSHDASNKNQQNNKVQPSAGPLPENNENEKAMSALDLPLRKALSRKHQLPLTAMEIERRETEIQLLAKLAESDAVMDDLWSVWFHERGFEGAKQMSQVEQLMANPAQWGQAELLIRKLIDRHGTTWAEPINRLATLFYMQGRLWESEQLCRIVLCIKPWHFGALSGIVMVYASLNKPHMAKQFAARRLPTLPPPPTPEQKQQQLQKNKGEQDPSNFRRRHLWAHNATEQASQMLKQLIQERGDWWGPADAHQYKKRKTMEQLLFSGNDDSQVTLSGLVNEDNAWQ